MAGQVQDNFSGVCTVSLTCEESNAGGALVDSWSSRALPPRRRPVRTQICTKRLAVRGIGAARRDARRGWTLVFSIPVSYLAVDGQAAPQNG